MGRLGWATILGCLLGMFIVGMLLRGCNAGADAPEVASSGSTGTSEVLPAPQPRPSVSPTGSSGVRPTNAPVRRPLMDQARREQQQFRDRMTTAVPTPVTPTIAETREQNLRANRSESAVNRPRAITPPRVTSGGASVSSPGAAPIPVGGVSPAIGVNEALAPQVVPQSFIPRNLSRPAGGSSSSAEPAPGDPAPPPSPTSNPNFNNLLNNFGGFTTTGVPTTTGNPGGGTTTPTLGAFSLILPGIGASGVATTTAFTWTPSTGATSYRFRLSTINTFETSVVDQSNIAATTFTPAAPLQPNTTYFWQVTASDGSSTRLSNTNSFTTGSGGSTPGASAPGPFALTAPANNARGLTGAVALAWSPAERAATYSVVVGRDAALTQVVASATGLTGTTFEVPSASVEAGTDYFWRVTAVNGAGQTVATPNPGKFTTLGAPGPFALLTPANNVQNLALPIVLTWAPSADAATYRVEVATDAAFQNRVVNRANLTAPTTVLTSADVQPGTTYFWRVTATNAIDSRGSTNTFRFSTREGPGPFAMLSPANNASTGLPVTLDWDDSAGAMLYRVEVSTSANFSSTIVNQLVVPLVSGTSFQVPDGLLQTGQTYFWRVTASNEAGDRVLTAFRFTIGVADYDVNKDGRVDALDLYAYSTMNPRPDLNNDGQANDADRMGLRGAIRAAEAATSVVRN